MRLVLAVGLNGEIGIHNDLPWGFKQKSDLLRFKRLTHGGLLIMGRNTFESIGRILPDRVSLVVTSQIGTFPGCITTTSPEDARSISFSQTNPVFLIGGKRLIESMIDDVDEINLTVIEASFNADTYIDNDIFNGFELVQKTSFPSDLENQNPYRFETWRRKR